MIYLIISLPPSFPSSKIHHDVLHKVHGSHGDIREPSLTFQTSLKYPTEQEVDMWGLVRLEDKKGGPFGIKYFASTNLHKIHRVASYDL